MVWALCSFLFIACNNPKPTEQKTEATDTSANVTKETAPAEFADAKYSEIGKKGIDALSAGDVDGWVAGYADNAVFLWNNGDSLAGKQLLLNTGKKEEQK